jgi:hypothetical protein|nr:MAG TPA: hypothetical protein [Caudoviricetes sp.]
MFAEEFSPGRHRRRTRPAKGFAVIAAKPQGKRKQECYFDVCWV